MTEFMMVAKVVLILAGTRLAIQEDKKQFWAGLAIIVLTGISLATGVP